MLRRLVPLAVATLALTAAAGCGGSDAKSTPSPTTAPAASAPVDTEAQSSSTLDPTIGKWTGTGTEIQRSGKSRAYKVTLEIAALDPHSSAGRIDYPSFPCGGSLRYLGPVSGGGQSFRELIQYGKAKCSRGGMITVQLQGQALDWRWEDPGGLVVTATLQRA